jgi:gas vesicle protein
MPNQSTGDVGAAATVAEPRAIPNGSAAVLVFVAGMAAGVVLGLMVAPASGASLRRGVGRKLREGTDWMKSKATEAEQEFLTQSAGLRDGMKAAAAAVK